MRPLRMSMSAFGPYKEQEVIDFSPLTDHRLFVISGNTGAGKTSIFDAICYALFGTASGQDREDPRMLRSHFASDDMYTSVDLQFEIKHRRYRIFRQMPHQKLGNKSETGGKVELYEMKESGEEPLLDKFTTTEVRDKIESLLGLSRDQFIQIVMLPQGEFRKLLTSETENKEEILRRIFKTDFYQKVQERFQVRRKQLQDRWLKQKSELGVRLSQIKEQLPEREEAPLFAELAHDPPNIAKVLDGLREEQHTHEKQVEIYTTQRKMMNDRIRQEETNLAQAKQWEKRFLDYEDKKITFQRLSDQRPQYEQLEEKLEFAQKAAELAPYYDQWKKAKARLEEKQTDYKHQLQRTKRAEINVEAAEAAYVTEEKKEQERWQLERDVERLEQLMPKIQQWKQQERSIQQRELQIEKIQRSYIQVEQELEQAKNAKAQVEEEITRLGQSLDRLPDEITLLEKRKQQKEWLAEWMLVLEKFEQHQKDITYAKQHVLDKRKAYEQMEQRWLDGQAAVLAEQLRDDEACPVCGSLEHPHKATAIHGQIITKTEIDEMRSELSHWEKILTKANMEAAAASDIKQSHENRLGEQGITLHHYDQICKEVEQLEGEVKRLQNIRPALEQKKALQRNLAQSIDEKSKDREGKQQQLNGEKMLLETERAVLERERAEWQQNDEDLTQVESKIVKLREELDQAMKRWKNVQLKRQEAREYAVREKATLERVLAEGKEARVYHEETEKEWSTHLAQSGLTDEKSFTQAIVEPDMREQWKSQLELYKLELSGLENILAEEEKLLSTQLRVNLEQLEQQVDELRKEEEALRGKQSESEKWRNSAEQIYAKVKQSSEDLDQSERQLAEISAVFDVMRGDNPLKLSFERYILIEFLEQILEAANQRLYQLSQGQFYLQRSERLERHKRQSGLGLDVYDSYTGLARDVKTLSGGEKFNASLALALGMTDVIQSHQGGVSIEMMFIDEGFGSLDEEALQQAIDTLIELQQAGRMIGVISHVQDLKKSFPAVLEVEKTREGHSRTRWKLTGV